jgi:hypothetical protein
MRLKASHGPTLAFPWFAQAIARDGSERCGRDGRMLAARVEPKNGPKTARTISSKQPALDQNTISGTTSKRPSDAPSRMITISGTSDHHHLEFVIAIVWND